MKINELLTAINGLSRLNADKWSKGIAVYTSEHRKYDYFLYFNFDADSWDKVDFDWDCLDGVRPNTLGKALELVDEFLTTPIKERYPEKKYWLTSNPDALKEYGINIFKYVSCISYDSNGFTFRWGKPNAYSESELDDIKKCCPFIAPAIDAMKEPVEDD